MYVSKAIRVMNSRPIGPWVAGAQPSWLGGAAPSLFGRWRRDPPDGGVSINHLGYSVYICTPLCTSINQSIHSPQYTLHTWYHELGFPPCSFRYHSAPIRCAPTLCAGDLPPHPPWLGPAPPPRMPSTLPPPRRSARPP